MRNIRKNGWKKINVTLKKELEKVQSENEKKIKDLENELIEKEKYINELQTGIGFIKSNFSNLVDKGKLCSSSIINFGDLYLIEERQKKFNKKIKKWIVISWINIKEELI